MMEVEGSGLQTKLTKAEIIDNIEKKLASKSYSVSKSEIHEVIEEFLQKLRMGLLVVVLLS